MDWAALEALSQTPQWKEYQGLLEDRLKGLMAQWISSEYDPLKHAALHAKALEVKYISGILDRALAEHKDNPGQPKETT